MKILEKRNEIEEKNLNEKRMDCRGAESCLGHGRAYAVKDKKLAGRKP